MKRTLFYLAGLLSLASVAKANLNVINGTFEAIDISAQHFTAVWQNAPYLKKKQSPQVVTLYRNTPIWGGCSGNRGVGNRGHVEGSQWCSYTNTISLVVEQLQDIYSRYEDGAIFYVVAHEFAHAFQTYNRQTYQWTRLPDPMNELQADCYAGMFARSAEKKLKIDLKDYFEMAGAAYYVGSSSSKTHGRPTQRRHALLLGSGFFKRTSCEVKDIQSIAYASDSELERRYLSLFGSPSLGINSLKSNSFKSGPSYKNSISDFTKEPVSESNNIISDSHVPSKFLRVFEKLIQTFKTN